MGFVARLCQTRKGFCLCACLVATVVTICVRIEILNARIGGYLPRTDFGGASRKWRTASRLAIRRGTERRLRMERSSHHQREQGAELTLAEQRELLDAPLTQEEEAVVQAELEYSQRRKQLHNWVALGGFAQAVLAPAALLWSLCLCISSGALAYRAAGACFAILSAISVFFMLHRGYLTCGVWDL